MAITDARPVTRYGEAYRLYFPIFSETGEVSSTTGMTASISIDGGDFAATTNNPTQIQTSGMFYIDLTAAEMTGYAVAIKIDPSDPNMRTTPVVLYPEREGDIRVHTLSVESTVSVDIAESVLSETVPGTNAPTTVGGVLGAMLGRMPNLVVVTPLLEGGNITLVRGDDYRTADGRNLTWTETSGTWPDLTGASVFLIIGDARFFRKQIDILTPTGMNKTVSADLTATETRKLTQNSYGFYVEAIMSSGSRVTLLKGYTKILSNI